MATSTCYSLLYKWYSVERGFEVCTVAMTPVLHGRLVAGGDAEETGGGEQAVCREAGTGSGGRRYDGC